MIKQVETFLERHETHQLLNQHAFERAGRFLLPLPMLWLSDLKFGQLLLDLGKSGDRDGNSGKRTVRVSFILNLSTVGDLRADFTILDKAVSGMFGLASEAACATVRNQLPELVKRLQMHGYTVYDITCQVLAPETLNTMTLVDQVARDGVLNVVI
ncbi:MAG: hypothetical protein JRH15_12560 [Deltaproteobacteria bacterium]|nr:hypothetical protein [Deltaproteobacteria bacterium]